MPIYEYKCQDCGAILDILHDMNAQVKRCGFRCQIPPENQDDNRGLGLLARSLPTFTTRNGSQMREKPSARDMEKHGFSIYKNEGGGTIKKITGKGPDVIHTPQSKS